MRTLLVLLASLFQVAGSFAAEPLWVHRYAGDGTQADVANALLIASDAVFSAGLVWRAEPGVLEPRGYLTRHALSTGLPAWSVEVGLQCKVVVEVPGSSDIAVGCGGATSGYGLHVFGADGTPRWSAVGANLFGGLAVDAQGRLFLAHTQRFGALSSVQMQAYRADGQALWTGEYLGPENTAQALVVAADGQGGAVVAGTVSSVAQSLDVLVMRFASGGAVAWDRSFGGPGAFVLDEAADLKVQGTDIYVAGTVDGNTSAGSDGFVARLDLAGNIAWQTRVGTSPGRAEAFYALSVDANGGVYAVGMSTLDASATDPLIAALDSNGALRWLQHSPSPFAAANRYLHVQLDAAGQPHAVGSVALASGSPSARYDSFSRQGLLLRRESYLGPASAARARALTLDTQGNVYLAGSVAASGTGYDALVLRYEAELIFASGYED